MKKYVTVLMDGMADYPVDSIGGKTPMMVAQKPNIDYMAQNGEVGLVRTVADGMSPGSDVANLAALGYDARQVYTGRSPLEAVSMGINMKETDIALRCNLVTLSDEDNYEDKKMVDYCGGDIGTCEAKLLIEEIENKLGNDIFKFYSGIQYRHCLIWNKGRCDIGKLTPPHDISGAVIKEHLNSSADAACLIELMKKSYDILKDHPVNKSRTERGLRPANSIWLWGQGTKPSLENFYNKFGKKGAIVSAVDLLKGIGLCAGMRICNVEGATGYIDTCFEKKTDAALAALADGDDFAFIHFEAPDECGHRGEVENKVKSIELIDELVVGKLLKELEVYDDYRIIVMPDHPTPLSVRTHVSDPVPYVVFDKNNKKKSGIDNLNEESAKQTGIFVEEGFKLINRLFDGE